MSVVHRVIRPDDARTTPWKNGGGVTAEIAVHPPGAGFDDFDWRISIARIAAESPFSPLPDIDRTLVMVAGEGLDLRLGERPAVRLDAASAPFAFPGEVPCRGRPVGGPVAAFNVMTRRATRTHAVHRLSPRGTTVLDRGKDETLLFVERGRFAAGPHDLTAGDTLAFEGPLAVATQDGTALVVTIKPR